MKTPNKTILAAVVVLAPIMWCSQVVAQSLAPKYTLSSEGAVEIQAEQNFVMQQPPESYAIPFRPTIDANAYAAAKQAAAANYSPLAVKPGAGALRPAPMLRTYRNFDGASSVDGLRPPDTHGAAGLQEFVEVTNSHFTVFRKNTGAVTKNVSLATFFGYSTEIIFDPRVVYDSVWNRWIVTATAFPESSTVQYWFIGVSKTPNPKGAFYIYQANVTFSSGDLFDFPTLGFDQDAVIVTANIFAGGITFVGADEFSIAKARLYNGLGFSVPVFTGLVGTLQPPIVLDQNGSSFLLAAPTSGTTLTKYTLTCSSHPNCTALVASTVPVPFYGIPPDAHQSGTTDLLDTSDSRFVNASTQSGNDLWQTHTVALGAFPGPKFYRIDTSTNTITQSSFFFQSGTSDDWNASITANTPSNDAFVTWSSTDASVGVNAQVIFSGKTDLAGAIPAGLVAFTSPTFYNPSTDTVERWGDYSAITVDPSNTSRAWLVNEKINTTALWGSRITQGSVTP
jgi:hypothetical protein